MDIDASYNSATWGGSDVNHRGVCPEGWHLPSDAEWTALTAYVGSNAGTKLKKATGWNSYFGIPAGTDDFGFAALPGGCGSSGGNFYNAGNYGFWWSSAEDVSYYAWIRNMYYGSEGVYRYDDVKSLLFSVRCLQD
jgi:uncharacterized protein (TIGR02145 family)